MNLRHLEVFHAVMQAGSVTSAALQARAVVKPSSSLILAI